MRCPTTGSALGFTPRAGVIVAVCVPACVSGCRPVSGPAPGVGQGQTAMLSPAPGPPWPSASKRWSGSSRQAPGRRPCLGCIGGAPPGPSSELGVFHELLGRSLLQPAMTEPGRIGPHHHGRTTILGLAPAVQLIPGDVAHQLDHVHGGSQTGVCLAIRVQTMVQRMSKHSAFSGLITP